MTGQTTPWHDYLGIVGAGLGGYIAPSTVAALGLAMAPAATAAIGATGLGLVGYSTGRLLVQHLSQSNGRYKTVAPPDVEPGTALALRRLHLDFVESPLASPTALKAGLADSTTKLRWAKLIGRADDPRIHTDLHVPTSSFSGSVAPSSISLLNRAYSGERMISVVGPSIGVAAQVVCQGLAMRHQLPIHHDFSMAHGFDVLQQVTTRSSTPDFLVLSDGSFFLAGHKLHKQYARVLPLHTDSQYLAISKVPSSPVPKRVLAVPGTASELQAISGYGLPSGTEIRQIEAADVPALLRSETDRSLGVLVWDALMTGVLRTPGAQMIPSPDTYALWTSLYAHKKWLRPQRSGLLAAFLEAWIAEWQYCRAMPDVSGGLLIQDRRHLAAFAAGCGLGPASITRSV